MNGNELVLNGGQILLSNLFYVLSNTQNKTMAKSIFQGMTDYSIQSLDDILSDLTKSINFAIEDEKFINERIHKLTIKNCWDSNEIPTEFRIIIKNILKYLQTVQKTLEQLTIELSQNVQEQHILQLEHIGKTASRLASDIEHYWKKEYDDIQLYKNPNYKIIEDIYNQSVTILLYLGDTLQMSEQLKKEVKMNKNIVNNISGNNNNVINGDNNNNSVITGDKNLTKLEMKNHASKDEDSIWKKIKDIILKNSGTIITGIITALATLAIQNLEFIKRLLK